MNRLTWPQDPDDKERAKRAVSALQRDAMFAEFCKLVVIPSLTRASDSLRAMDPTEAPGRIELPRTQGAAQVMMDLINISRDAKDELSRQNHQQPTARPTGGSNE